MGSIMPKLMINSDPGIFPAPRFRIRLERDPKDRKDTRRYYAANSNGMFWTQMREIARDFDTEHVAQNIVARVLQRNAKLRGRIVVVPA
jgi:hypothetical protein